MVPTMISAEARTAWPSKMRPLQPCAVARPEPVPPGAPLKRSPPPSWDACPAPAKGARHRAPPGWGPFRRGRRRARGAPHTPRARGPPAGERSRGAGANSAL